MSYEYKDEIIMNLKDYNAGRKVTGGTHAFESKIEELHEVYSQVSEYEQYKVATTILVNTLKSKSDEYEAKAKAFDRIVRGRNQADTSMYGKDDDVFYKVVESAFWNIDGIIVGYESGERSE